MTSSFTWPFDSQVVISYRCSIGTKSVSPTVVEIIGPKYIGVMTLTFLGNVTSSVTWPFESQWVISDWWSIGPKSLSPAVFEIFGPKHIGVTTLIFQGHATSSNDQSRDHSNPNRSFPIGGPLDTNLYLQPFSRYLALSILRSRPWPFTVTSRDVIGHVTIWFPDSHFL